MYPQYYNDMHIKFFLKIEELEKIKHKVGKTFNHYRRKKIKKCTTENRLMSEFMNVELCVVAHVYNHALGRLRQDSEFKIILGYSK
jgi:hypothetical protein